jgi:capsular exopolysaccharide synthesis family protein
MVIGSMLGTGTAFLVEYLDDSIKTTEEMEKICRIPSLGVIPLVNGDSWKLPLFKADGRKLLGSAVSQKLGENGKMAGPIELLSHNEPMSMLGEAIQHIRTSLLLSSSDSAPRTIMITSGSPAEGKTTVSVNLSAALAGADRRCILVDCDVRKARIHTIFQKSMQPGLTNYLTGTATLEEIIQTTSIPNLYFIPAGPTPPNPNDLFSSALFGNLVSHLRSEFDHVIIDSPPIIGFADGRTIASLVDGVLLVFKHHFTTKKAGELAIHLLAQNNSRILGGILTMTKKGHLGYGGYYGYFKYYQKYYGGYYKAGTDESPAASDHVEH